MEVLLHNLDQWFSIIKHKKKKIMLTLGRDPIEFVSEEYCHNALTRSATSAAKNKLPYLHTSGVGNLVSRTARDINDL